MGRNVLELLINHSLLTCPLSDCVCLTLSIFFSSPLFLSWPSAQRTDHVPCMCFMCNKGITAFSVSLSHSSFLSQANLAVQQNRLAIANVDLQKARAELDAKQAELDVVQGEYEKAMMEKQVNSFTNFLKKHK